MTAPVEPIDWSGVEDAIYDWIVPLVVPAMVFANQNVPQPAAYPYCSALLTGDAKEGGQNEIRTSYDATQPAGQEIQQVTWAPHLLTYSLTFLVDQATVQQQGRQMLAFALANKAKASLGLPSVLDQLRSTGGLALVRELGVRDLSKVVNGEWIGQAVFDLQLRANLQMTEGTGYIQTADVSGTITEGDRTLAVPTFTVGA